VQAPPLRPTASRAGADRTHIIHIALPLSLAVTLLCLSLVLAVPGLGGATILVGFMRPAPLAPMGLPNTLGSAVVATHSRRHRSPPPRPVGFRASIRPSRGRSSVASRSRRVHTVRATAGWTSPPLPGRWCGRPSAAG
jgi:hypothetical protein